MKPIHIVALVLACLGAAAPILIPAMPKDWAGVMPAVVAVLAIAKHAADAADGDADSKQEPPK
jgi:hypothetical protein